MPSSITAAAAAAAAGSPLWCQTIEKLRADWNFGADNLTAKLVAAD